MFSDGECLHAAIKYSYWCITCLPIKQNNMIHIKCDLGFFVECPEYIIPDEVLYDGPNSLIIHFSVYTYQGRCSTHGIIPNRPSACILCEENGDINNGLIKRPTYGKKNNLTKISCSIGEFNKLHYQPILKKFAYHRMLLCLLGKHECKNIRREDFLADNNDVMKKRDYSESLKAEFGMVIQSEEFGSSRTLSIEVITCDYHNKYHNDVRNQGKVKMDLHSHFHMTLIIIQLLHLSI